MKVLTGHGVDEDVAKLFVDEAIKRARSGLLGKIAAKVAARGTARQAGGQR